MTRDRVSRRKEAESEQFTKKFREQGRGQVDEINKESKEDFIENKVKERIMEELKVSLKEQNKLTLERFSGDITGVINGIEEGQEITEDLFRGASQGSEEEMSEGLRKFLAETVKNLLPVGDTTSILNAMGIEMDKRTDANMEEYYERYKQTSEGKARIKEVREEVETEFNKK